MKSKSFVSKKQILKNIADEYADISNRWKYFFDLAEMESGIKSWEIVSMLHMAKSGKHISEKDFTYARVAKLVATTEKWKVNESLRTKKDVVNWNRQAIMAMIEAEKLGKIDVDKIERGYKAIEIINILYPEFLLK